MEGDWTNLLSITTEWTNQMCYCQFRWLQLKAVASRYVPQSLTQFLQKPVRSEAENREEPSMSFGCLLLWCLKGS